MYRQHGCIGVVAIGAGSPIDLAKGVALLATHEGELEQYAAVLDGMPKITSAVAPLMAVPATAGTGSEVERAALITLDDGGTNWASSARSGFRHPYRHHSGGRTVTTGRSYRLPQKLGEERLD